MSQIHVTRDFAGKLTREKRIWPGMYESGDERLFGIEDYLVEHGFAQRVNAPVEELADQIAAETGAEMVSFGVPLDENAGMTHEDDQQQPGDVTPPATAQSQLEELSWPEIKELAKAAGLQIDNHSTKVDILAALDVTGLPDDQMTLMEFKGRTLLVRKATE